MNRRNFLKAFLGIPLLLCSRGNGARLSIRTEGGTSPESKKINEPRTILLLKTVLAGFLYYEGENVWTRLRKDEPLVLLREPANPYDERAVGVCWQDKKLGFIPRVDNAVIAQLMDRGEKLTARIDWLAVSEDPWERMGIKVEMEVC